LIDWICIYSRRTIDPVAQSKTEANPFKFAQIYHGAQIHVSGREWIKYPRALLESTLFPSLGFSHAKVKSGLMRICALSTVNYLKVL